MRTASEVKMMVNGNVTSSLDIIREHNTFTIYEYDETVFRGGYSKTKEYIEAWKERHAALAELLREAGNKVEFSQNI